MQVCKAAFGGWRPLHAHKHPSQNFLDGPPVTSDQSMPGTAAVHGLDFFYESEIDYQQTVCPSASIKLSGPNSVICIFFFLLAGFFFLLWLFWGNKRRLYLCIHTVHSTNIFSKPPILDTGVD